MTKDEIIKALKKKGYKDWKIKSGSVGTHYHHKVVGNFKVFILLSNQVRLLIETSGTGTYYINVCDFKTSFKEVDDKKINAIAKHFDKLCKATESFSKQLTSLENIYYG